MKSAKIELAADDTISSRKCITDRDVSAFTARIVLEISLNISFPDGNLASSIYSDNFLHALQNICDQFGAEDVLKVCFIVKKYYVIRKINICCCGYIYVVFWVLHGKNV